MRAKLYKSTAAGDRNDLLTELQLDKCSHRCNSIDVTLFGSPLRPGESIFDQVVFAAKKAFVSGELRPGQTFPSVRSLAAELKIHPNTAHKVVQHLIQERFLEVRPGIGTVVAELPEARAGDKRRLLRQEVEQLVGEAKRVGVGREEVIEAIDAQWAKLENPLEVSRK
jgi:GntR family transcriptional regulator